MCEKCGYKEGESKTLMTVFYNGEIKDGEAISFAMHVNEEEMDKLPIEAIYVMDKSLAEHYERLAKEYEKRVQIKFIPIIDELLEKIADKLKKEKEKDAPPNPLH